MVPTNPMDVDDQGISMYVCPCLFSPTNVRNRRDLLLSAGVYYLPVLAWTVFAPRNLNLGIYGIPKACFSVFLAFQHKYLYFKFVSLPV